MLGSILADLNSNAFNAISETSLQVGVMDDTAWQYEYYQLYDYHGTEFIAGSDSCSA